MRFYTKEWYLNRMSPYLVHVVLMEEDWDEYEEELRGQVGEEVEGYLREQLEVAKEEMLVRWPEKFHPYILDGSINQKSLPREVRGQVAEWLFSFTDENPEADSYFASIQEKLPNEIAKLLSMRFGLREAKIKYIYREGDSLRLTIDARFMRQVHGFVVTFEGILFEKNHALLKEGMQWLKYEADITNEGKCSFSVLFLESLLEWTILASRVKLEILYRANYSFDFVQKTKGATEEQLKRLRESTHLGSSYKYLNLFYKQNGGEPNHPYFFTRTAIERIVHLYPLEELKMENNRIELGVTEQGLFVLCLQDEPVVYYETGGEVLQFATDLDDFLAQLMMKEYVDEEVLITETMKEEELDDALDSKNDLLIARAWNQMLQNPEKYTVFIEKGIIRMVEKEQQTGNRTDLVKQCFRLFDDQCQWSDGFKEKVLGMEGV